MLEVFINCVRRGILMIKSIRLKWGRRQVITALTDRATHVPQRCLQKEAIIEFEQDRKDIVVPIGF